MPSSNRYISVQSGGVCLAGFFIHTSESAPQRLLFYDEESSLRWQILPPLEKLMELQVDDVLALHPFRLGAALDQSHIEGVDDVRFLHGVPWCTNRCTQQPLPIALTGNDHLQVR